MKLRFLLTVGLVLTNVAAFGQAAQPVIPLTSGQPVSPTNPLPVTPSSGGAPQTVTGAVNVTPTDCSGTIAAGGTAQALFSAQTTLHGFFVMNLSTDKLGLAFNGNAVVDAAGTYSLNPATTGATGTAGGSFSAPLGFGVNTAVSIVGATTGDKYSCTRW